MNKSQNFTKNNRKLMTTKTITTDWPITLHGVCHVPDIFYDGTELCSIPYQNLVPEKSCTRLTNTRATFWYQFSVACVAYFKSDSGASRLCGKEMDRTYSAARGAGMGQNSEMSRIFMRRKSSAYAIFIT